jgi:hypothetical protein
VTSFSTTAFAAETSFFWIPNTEATLAGYKIHYGTASGEYQTVIDVGLPTVQDNRVQTTISDLADSTSYYAVATAYDTEGIEGEPSDEVAWTTPGEIGMPPIPTITTVREIQ